jgi:putative ABC transport system substrate-binding protein
VNRRRAALALVAFGLAPYAPAQPGKARRLGYLLLTPLGDSPSPERTSFLDELRRLGFVDGRNLRIEYRSAQNNRKALDALAEELVREKVDVIVTTSTPATRAASRATRAIPIVMIGIGDAQRARLVANFARPEANVTGVTWLTTELAAKRFQLLRETLPGAARVALVLNPDDGAAREQLPFVRQAAGVLRFELAEYHVAAADGLLMALEKLGRERPDAIFVMPDARMVTYRKIISDEALKLRIPCFSSYRGFVEAGALMSYAADLAELYRRGATYVARLLNGATVADLPVEQPTRFELVVNLRTAGALGVLVPQSILLRADEVIQ